MSDSSSTDGEDDDDAEFTEFIQELNDIEDDDENEIMAAAEDNVNRQQKLSSSASSSEKKTTTNEDGEETLGRNNPSASGTRFGNGSTGETTHNGESDVEAERWATHTANELIQRRSDPAKIDSIETSSTTDYLKSPQGNLFI